MRMKKMKTECKKSEMNCYSMNCCSTAYCSMPEAYRNCELVFCSWHCSWWRCSDV
jgi:hypothetical protein